MVLLRAQEDEDAVCCMYPTHAYGGGLDMWRARPSVLAGDEPFTICAFAAHGTRRPLFLPSLSPSTAVHSCDRAVSVCNGCSDSHRTTYAGRDPSRRDGHGKNASGEVNSFFVTSYFEVFFVRNFDKISGLFQRSSDLRQTRSLSSGRFTAVS